MISSLPPCRFACGNDSDPLIAPRVHDYEYPAEGVRAHRDEALFSGLLIWNRPCEFVLEYCGGVGEIDAVLDQIGGRFPRVPFDVHGSIYAQPYILSSAHSLGKRSCLRNHSAEQAGRRMPQSLPALTIRSMSFGSSGSRPDFGRRGVSVAQFLSMANTLRKSGSESSTRPMFTRATAHQ